MSRQVWFKAGAVVFALLLSLCVAEVGLRVVRHDSLFLMPERASAAYDAFSWRGYCAGRNESRIRTSDPVFDHGLAPLQSGECPYSADFYYTITTNSLGMRDATTRQVPLTAPGGRIVIIGDSFTEGVAVEYDKTFVGIIQARMASRGVDVLNAGCTSYSPAVYYAKTRHMIETVGLKFDRLIVFIDISDVQDEAQVYTLADGVVTGGGKKLNTRPEFRSAWTHDATAWKEYGERGLQLAQERMTLLADLLDRHGIALTVVVYPWPQQVDAGDIDSIQRRTWRDWCAANDAEFIDLWPTFVDAPNWRSLYLPSEMHWSTAGHQAVAGVLMERESCR